MEYSEMYIILALNNHEDEEMFLIRGKDGLVKQFNTVQEAEDFFLGQTGGFDYSDDFSAEYIDLDE